MPLSINFLGLNSFNDFGLYIAETPNIPMPQRRVNYITVPGMNGTVAEDDGKWDDITITVTFNVKSSNIINLSNRVKAWLVGGVGKLTFSDDHGYYYIAQVVNKFDIARTMRVLGKFPVVFNCKPFKKSIDDTNYIILDNCISRFGSVINPLNMYNFAGGTALSNNVPARIADTKQININNPGTVESDPILNIVGSGDISVALGSSTFSLFALDDYVTVDTPVKDAYKDTELRNNIMVGDFPTLSCGDINVSWSGAVSRIEIQCNSNWI